MGDWGLGNFAIFIIIFIIMILIVIYNVSKFDFLEAKTDNETDASDINEVDTNTSSTTASSYGELETKVNAAAKTYITKYYPNLSTGDQFVIKISSLVNDGIIATPVDVDNSAIKCSGYVTVYKEEMVAYKTYLKCGSNYMTDEYQARYDE